MKPTVLFTRSDSNYKLLNVECFDIAKDARKFKGNNVVICHPPCRAWGRLRHLSKPKEDEKELAVFALNMVRKNGGVLEHPYSSQLWKEFNLPIGSSVDEFGGFTFSINQSWFGHKCEKKTLLYIVGCCPSDLPNYPLSFDVITHVVSSKKRKGEQGYKKNISKEEREHTPIELCKWLIEVAKKCIVAK